MLPNENTELNALATMVASVTPSAIAPVATSYTPEVNTTSAVMVQTMMVSTNTSKMPHIPCCTGSFTLELECTITDEPRPASLENTPRLKPAVTTLLMTTPMPPPIMATGWNAFTKIARNAAPICA